MSDELLKLIADSVVIGVGATAVMDTWALILQRFMGITPLNYALVGRWITYMPKGIISHSNISVAKPVAMETLVGWIAHYLIGVIFALALLIFTGSSWVIEPSMLTAIVFGASTVIFPFLIMQPCLGLGIAAAKTPKPNIARFRSLLTHIVFGFGLYFSAITYTLFIRQ